jgi:hypothetical protein
MRISSIAYLCVSAIALTACAAGDSAYQLDTGLSTCGQSCGIKPTPVVVVPPVVPPGPLDTVNTGNETEITNNTGDKSITLSKSVLNSPVVGGARAKLTQDKVAKTAKIEIDTKSDRNSAFPKPKTMEQYDFGTMFDTPIVAPLVAAGIMPKNLAATEYHEYRTSEAIDGADVDEEMQVWEWQYSRATQYRDKTGGGEARNQAWTFGAKPAFGATPAGEKTTALAMTTRGSASYTGFYTSTAKTWSNIDRPLTGQTLSRNNLWQVEGRSKANVDFVSGAFNATLTPDVWIGWQSINGATGFKAVAVDHTCNDTIDYNCQANQFYYMNDDIVLKGLISNDVATGNQIIGTAKQDTNSNASAGLPAEWLTSANPMYGSVFGPTANEVTGIFSLKAETPDPYGGSIAINDDRAAYIQQSGVFHAQ